MVRLLISVVLHLVGNAVGLVVASLILDDMSINGAAFVFAVIIFTVVEVIAEPLLQKIALKNAHALTGSVALVTTFIGLLVTDVFSDGLSITGAWTWILATIIVWLATLLAAIILPALFLKRAVDSDQSVRR